MRCSQHGEPLCLLLQSQVSTQPPGARGLGNAGAVGGSQRRAVCEAQQSARQYRDSSGYAVPTPCCKTRVGRSAEEQAASWRCASCAPFPQVQACSATPGIPPLLALASPHHYSRHPRSPRHDTATQPGGPGAPRSYIPRLRSTLSRDGVFAPVQRWGENKDSCLLREEGRGSLSRPGGRPARGRVPGRARSVPQRAGRCASWHGPVCPPLHEPLNIAPAPGEGGDCPVWTAAPARSAATRPPGDGTRRDRPEGRDPRARPDRAPTCRGGSSAERPAPAPGARLVPPPAAAVPVRPRPPFHTGGVTPLHPQRPLRCGGGGTQAPQDR